MGDSQPIVTWLQKAFSSFYARHVGGERRPVFYDMGAECPQLAVLDEHVETIARELQALLDERASLPDVVDIDPAQATIGARDESGRAWKAFFLSAAGVDMRDNMARCPETSRLVKSIPNMAQAFFSVLDPGRAIVAHHGPYLGTLRYHLAIVVPERNPPWIRVRDATYVWRRGESILFDDTWEHEVGNESDGVRVVLVVDVLRRLPWLPHAVNWLYMFVGGRVVYGWATVRKGLRRDEERRAA